MTKQNKGRKPPATQSNGCTVQLNGQAADDCRVAPLESLASGPRSRWLRRLEAAEFDSEIASAGERGPEIRHGRIERLRAAIHSGSYRVSDEEIAGAMWTDLFG